MTFALQVRHDAYLLLHEGRVLNYLEQIYSVELYG